jgi:RHH-type proline utilization regulon transcriptional repressor/proline dehydrogenase/delta 1-pyrroline-5-carboxylate dehydrogenase
VAVTAGPVTGDDAELARRAEALATRLLERAVERRGWREQVQGRRIARLLDDPDGLAFVLALTDEVLRIRDRRRAARHLRSLVAPAPAFLGPLDRRLLGVGAGLAERLPHLVMPLVGARVRAELAGFVLPAERRPLRRRIARRQAAGTRINVNLLGEAVLGDDEASRRLAQILELLDRPEVDHVSVKITAVCAQLHPVAFDHEVERIARPLRALYDAALAHRPAKFVNLDMEEQRDLDLTVAAFRRVLDEDRYAGLDAGIVLQAYLPDSLGVLRDLADWARERHRCHGGATRVRIVKGANLAMEAVEAEIAGWPQAPFTSKAEVDAAYKRMLDVALDPANRAALRIGVASHNLFEVAWALTLSDARGVREMVEPEMLEGMAPSMAAAVREEAGGLLLYAPVAHRGDDESVIAYLVRRFDENTGPDNFLRHQFSLRPGSPGWAAERDRFVAAVAARRRTPPPTRRTQDRSVEGWRDRPPPAGFRNEPDTDLSVAANRRWVARHLRPFDELGVDLVPAVVAGRTVTAGATEEGRDPAAPDRVAYRWVRAGTALVDEAVATARTAGPRWAATGPGERCRVLEGAADALAAARGRLLGVMAADGGKTVAEADPEISEAIDMARWYGRCALGLDAPGSARFHPYGTVAVVPPWNFPVAIPAGGVLAALAAGNAVILKPAPETVATAWAVAEACWAGGVDRQVLQFVPCADDDAGRRLVTHPDVDAVVLTGSWDTARAFLGWRPGLRLHAETSGKNALVITAAADLDAAVADLVRSAFGHAGQKCSAASLAIVESPVYDDDRFRRQLADAVRTLRPGPGWDTATTMGPLIRPPEDPLARALTRLDPGESWLVAPRRLGPQLWSPGVKLGVRPGSPFHLTECFGPVLGLMRAADLDQAIAWQNRSPFGLTAGLHSLDPAEVARWRERVEAGNLYVNRHITGAVVRRQPFGGWKRSVVGPGAKAGGPHYVASLGTWTATFDGGAAAFADAVRNAWAGDLRPSDPTGLAAEANVLRYRPLPRVLVRAGVGAGDRDVALALAAARATGVAVEVSSAVPRPEVGAHTVEDEAALAARLGDVRVDKLRFLDRPGDALRLAAHDAGLWVDDLAVVAAPRIEALRWAREQALSETRHRHGDLTGRHKGPLDP